MNAFRGLRSTAWIAAGLLFVSSMAHAQSSSPVALAQAQKLFEEAVALMDAKTYATACPKLEKVTDLVPMGIGGHEMLADCYETLGRFGSAWEQFTIAKTLSQKAGEPARATTNASRAAALEPKVAKITIVVDKELRNVGGLTILRDGEVQDPALWNTPLPVDTGKHRIEAKALGRESWSKEVTVLADGVSLQVEVPMRKLELSAVAPTLPGGMVLQAADSGPPRAWQRPVGFTAMGLGVGSLLTSAILSGAAVSARDSSIATGHCIANNVCDAMGLSLREEALSYANGATATVIAGGVLAAGGLVLVLTAPKKESAEDEKKNMGLTWGLSFTPSSASVQGTW